MTLEEFSNEFDTLIQSYISTAQIGEASSIAFDEYEKSVFLTKAQEEVVKDLYFNKYTGDSFESTEEARRFLNSLIVQKIYPEVTQVSTLSLEDLELTDPVETTPSEDSNTEDTDTEDTDGEDTDNDDESSDSTVEEVTISNIVDEYTHTIYSIPSTCMYIIYELVTWSSTNTCINGKVADVIPVTHDEYWRVKNNPFRGPNNKRVLRLDNGNLLIELISNNTIGSYLIRYLSKPKPIILANIENLTIDGVSTVQNCELPSALHRIILDKAVLIALSTKANSNK